MQLLIQKALDALYAENFLLRTLHKITWKFSSLQAKQRHIQHYETTLLQCIDEVYHNEQLTTLCKLLFHDSLFLTFPTKENTIDLCAMIDVFATFCSDSTINPQNYYTLLRIIHPNLSFSNQIEKDVLENSSMLLIEEHAALFSLPAEKLEQLLTRYAFSFPRVRNKHVLLSLNCIIKIAEKISTLFDYTQEQEEELRNNLCVLQSIYLYMCATLQRNELALLFENTPYALEDVVPKIIQECALDELCKHFGENSNSIYKTKILLKHIPQKAYAQKAGAVTELVLILHHAITTHQELFSLSLQNFQILVESFHLGDEKSLQDISNTLNRLNAIAILYSNNKLHTQCELIQLTRLYKELPQEYTNALISNLQHFSSTEKSLQLPINALLQLDCNGMYTPNFFYALFNTKDCQPLPQNSIQQNLYFVTTRSEDPSLFKLFPNTPEEIQEYLPYTFSLSTAAFSTIFHTLVQDSNLCATKIYEKFLFVEGILRTLHTKSTNSLEQYIPQEENLVQNIDILMQ